MFNDIDDDDEGPVVFKRSSTSNVRNQLNSSAKKSSSQLHSVQQQGRPVSDARSNTPQNSTPHNGKIASSSKPSSMKSPLATPKAPTSSAAGPPVKSPLASPKGSNSSASGPPVKSPVIHSKSVPPVADRPTKITSVVKEERDLVKTEAANSSDSEDSEDVKPLSVRLSTGLSKGNTNQANKGLSTTAAHGSRVLPKSNVTAKCSPDDSDDEDEVPLSSRFQLKSNAGASTSRPYDSNEKKPLASKPNQNGSIARSSQQGKSPTVLSKRPIDEANSSGQSLVKKPKFPVSSTASKGKQVPVKAEIKEEDEDHMPISQRIKKSSSQDSKSQSTASKGKQVPVKAEIEEDEDHMPISQRIKKSSSQDSKSQSSKKTVTKVVSSSFKKSTKSKKFSKSSEYSKSTKVQPNSGDGQKWTTLIHNGVIFPPPYKPHGIKMLYDGKPVDLTPEQEEVATMFAVMKETEYASKSTFIENFMNDWRKLLGKNHIIKDFTRCDFTPIHEWHEREKEKKKQMSTDEKKALKEEKLKQEEKYMWAIVDGVKEKVGNFRVEPPGLFRGRGEHPKMGKLKKRIRPSEITINIGKNAPIPECPIPGESWKEIKHDNTVTWLAFWNDPINQKEFKYVFLAASSSLKGQSDKEKYEKARLLQNHIHGIRAAYTKNFASADKTKRQIAVATYLIDKLALRAGNEKDDDEADTVGCCTLKVENVKPKPPNILQFDFLGKDSIRYENEVEVELPVYKAIEKFRVGKTEGDDLFDMLDTSKLNAHLKELMPGLTAKVFRTYNASITLDDMLRKDTKDGNVAENIVVYQQANKQVAIICNHQRSVSKSHSMQMSKLTEKIDELKSMVEELKTDLARSKKGKPPLKDSDGKRKRNLTPEALERKIEQTNGKIEKMELNKQTKEELKTVALGTSKLNYLDPRITVAWCKRHEVPIEKMFNKSLLAKFSWAMDVDPDFRF